VSAIEALSAAADLAGGAAGLGDGGAAAASGAGDAAVDAVCVREPFAAEGVFDGDKDLTAALVLAHALAPDVGGIGAGVDDARLFSAFGTAKTGLKVFHLEVWMGAIRPLLVSALTVEAKIPVKRALSDVHLFGGCAVGQVGVVGEMGRAAHGFLHASLLVVAAVVGVGADPAVLGPLHEGPMRDIDDLGDNGHWEDFPQMVGPIDGLVIMFTEALREMIGISADEAFGRPVLQGALGDAGVIGYLSERHMVPEPIGLLDVRDGVCAPTHSLNAGW